MPYYTRVAVGLLLLGAGTAEAQLAPGGGLPTGGQPGQQEEQKKEGVAEAAPKTPGLLPTTPALPPPRGRRKQWKLFEIDGYFRLRTDWWKNFHLGHTDLPGEGGAAFPRSLGCAAPTTVNASCDDSLSSMTMRLRLEPTINLSEGTSVHVQADVLDNLVLGSTPSGEEIGSYSTTNRPPVGAFGSTQGVPVAGINSDRDSILVKRAWAEVAVPLGVLKFGRQPNHWGMGIWHNAGGRDPIAGTTDTDADYGDSVDRVSFSGLIPGTNLRAMLGLDWNSTRLASNQTSLGKGREGRPWDLDDRDDSASWVGVISRMDTPQEFQDQIDRGEVAFNYGVYFEYKTQAFDNDLTDFALGGTLDSATRYVPRDLKSYSPDVWAKLGYRKLLVEIEALAQLGTVERLDDVDDSLSGADLRKYAATARLTWRGLEDKLRLGFEAGAASGDQWDNTPQGNTHIGYANLLGDRSDGKLSQFIFNRDYRVDMILFRHLIGAVTNAAYFKPFLSYELTQSFSFRVANITSLAVKPVATPGNARMYGTEFNADLSYASGGLTAAIGYGVLFPLAALNHPLDLFPVEDGDPNVSNAGDASTAHAIQTRLVLAF
jgi:uncharacterized protein (TIGR04551 family)